MSFILPFLVAFFLLPFVQKFLQTAERLPEWHDRIRIGRLIAFGLLLVEVVTDGEKISPPVFFGLLILVAYPAYLLKEEVPNARLLFWMIVPLGVVFFIDNLAEYWMPRFYENYDLFFQTAKSIVFVLSFVLAIIARNQQREFNKQRQKLVQEEENNRILEAKKLDLEYQVAERTAEITKQKEELQQALEHLKATQEQLIQSEKLASLGELTAGIAHEIQNPLNFVNNFSEVSVELLEELKTERARPTEDRDEGLEAEILDDIFQNLEKINHHGKRASSIVTGMLQHSRASTGKKEPVNLNALADEYLRLSYHGLRAKDKSFNAKMNTFFDESLPKVNVIPQDFGRVLLNLINNAFYAVQARSISQPENYMPTVTVSTQNTDQGIIIKVGDNGTGIPEELKSKIFQPFFTTKPTGQGTGLGLSLAYDIVTKSHGGTIELDSVEGEGTTFTITLPNH
ncbi:signal transduction histidine kinase [Runella defluvii]|uniref:histidine kinase n=1 Tax=Runella defluvii TaxID=370973 RepID=A0A7W6ENM7_9BACT|nr:ATP-binding protein [Runella defluvii]MBB3836506.1 signal transduction histidine kinase [Runella defluvii]